MQPANGTAPPQVLLERGLQPSSWTPDGRHLAAVQGGDIVVVSLDDGKASARRPFQTPHTERWPEFSPDGRWLTYGSDVSGRFEVWVRPYPTGDPVPVEEGESPAWHPNGRELFFVSPSDPSGRRRMMAVAFTPGSPRPTIGRPRPLFEFEARGLSFAYFPVRCYDVARDGQRFYVMKRLHPPPAPVVRHVNLITNWFEELKAKVPTTR